MWRNHRNHINHPCAEKTMEGDGTKRPAEDRAAGRGNRHMEEGPKPALGCGAAVTHKHEPSISSQQDPRTVCRVSPRRCRPDRRQTRLPEAPPAAFQGAAWADAACSCWGRAPGWICSLSTQLTSIPPPGESERQTALLLPRSSFFFSFFMSQSE